MFDLVSNIGRCDIVVESFRVIANDDLAFAFTFILPLDELLLDVIVAEGLNKGTELLLLVVAGGAAGVHEDGRGNDRCQYLWLLELALVYVEHNQQVEVYALVVVSRRGKFYCAEVDLPVDHLHLALSPDTHIDQSHPVRLLVLRVFLHSEDLRLNRITVTYRLRGERRKSPVV